MKYLIIIIMLLGLGCTAGDPQVSIQSLRTCEYIVIRDRNGISIIHAGDCENPMHYAGTKRDNKLKPVNTTGWKKSELLQR